MVEQLFSSRNQKVNHPPKKILFTVIVPVFNREQLVCESLDSVKFQSYRPIEIIVIDDGSTDQSYKVVNNWASKNHEGELFTINCIHQPNAGASAARNNGINRISGEYVQFLDSDDRLHPERLQRLVAEFNKTDADFIQTGFDGFDADTGDVISNHFGRPEEDQVELALRGLLWANTLRSAFRRPLVEKIGPWDTEMTCFEDRDYVERAVVQAEKPIAIREILASARRGGSERISDRLRTYEGRKFRILCEERLCKGALTRSDISIAAKQAFSSRLYALGFRSNASGWTDHGKWCGEIAESMGVDLDTKGRVRRLVWKSGRVGGALYGLLSKLKFALGVR